MLVIIEAPAVPFPFFPFQKLCCEINPGRMEGNDLVPKRFASSQAFFAGHS